MTIIDIHGFICSNLNMKQLLLLRIFYLIKTQFGASIKLVRSDNDIELFNSQCKDLFHNLGIINQSSFCHTLHQNGMVERKHRHILNMARSIRFHFLLLLKF